jgi:hypothetical protein
MDSISSIKWSNSDFYLMPNLVATMAIASIHSSESLNVALTDCYPRRLSKDAKDRGISSFESCFLFSAISSSLHFGSSKLPNINEEKIMREKFIYYLDTSILISIFSKTEMNMKIESIKIERKGG